MTGIQSVCTPGELLGSYVAPIQNVNITPTTMFGSDGHRVWEYRISLGQTHLDHAIAGLSTPKAFLEQRDDIYWISIAAENGHFIDPNTRQSDDNGDPVPLDPQSQEPTHFWGWHTSPDAFNDIAVMGELLMPEKEWKYFNWKPIEPEHGPEAPPRAPAAGSASPRPSCPFPRKFPSRTEARGTPRPRRVHSRRTRHVERGERTSQALSRSKYVQPP